MHPRRFQLILMVIVCLLVIQVAKADESDKPDENQASVEELSLQFEIEEVVISASREETLLHTPASISIITRDEIESMAAKDLGELLKRVPGAFDSSASAANLTIRGAGSAMAGGATVLVDGVEQKISVGGYSEFQFIPISQIERIEVMRSVGIAQGPGSARGVINVITRKNVGKKRFGAEISGSYGSWNSTDEQASIFGRWGDFDYFANLNHSSSDGYEQEGRQTFAGLLCVGHELVRNGRIEVKAKLADHDRQLAYGFYKHQWHIENFRRDKHFPRSVDDPRLIWHNNKDQALIALSVGYEQRASNWFVWANLSRTDFSERYQFDALKNISTKRVYREQRDQLAYAAQFKGGFQLSWDKLLLTESVGMRLDSIQFSSQRFYPAVPDRDVSAYGIDVTQSLLGLYWDNQLLGDKWSMSAGVRLDGLFLSHFAVGDQVTDKNRWLFGFKVAPAYHFDSDSNLYLSVNRTYWSPPVRYLAWSVQNESDQNRFSDLKPEVATTLELGYKRSFSKVFQILVSVFYTTYVDKFVSEYDQLNFVGMTNGGEAFFGGVELEFSSRVLRWLGCRVVADWMHAKWKNGQQKVRSHPSNAETVIDLAQKRVHGVPFWNFVAGLDLFLFSQWRFSLDLNGTGPAYIDYDNRLRTEVVLTVDAGLRYQGQQYHFWLVAKNLLDAALQRVYNSSGALTESGGIPNNRYYVLDGRYLELGLAVKW